METGAGQMQLLTSVKMTSARKRFFFDAEDAITSVSWAGPRF